MATRSILHKLNSQTNMLARFSKMKCNACSRTNPHLDATHLRFIDLFCGIGGFHQALVNLGHECVFACDIDANCRQTYRLNYGIEPAGDITTIDERDIPPFDILCAGFPCQPFSKAGTQQGFNDATRGTLFHDIMRIARHHNPRWLVLENVRNIVTHDGGNTWKTIRKCIQDAGYNTYDAPIIANALHFQVPQFRERVLILASRCDLKFPEYPQLCKNPKGLLNVFLSDIVDPDDHERPHMTDKYWATRRVWNAFLKILHENCIPVPKFPIWTDWWDRGVLSSTVMVTAKYNEVAFYEKYKSWIDSNQEFYFTNKEILEPWLEYSRSNEPLWKGAVRKFEWQVSVNGSTADNLDTTLWTLRGSGVRVKRADYAPTLVAMSMIPVYGPLNARLSPRELLRLQSFPDTFQYDPKHIYKQVGNSVNVRMIEWAIDLLINFECL